MATILQKPGDIALSGNIKDIIISTSADVDFEIMEKNSGTVILNETYSPDENDRVAIRLRDLLPSQLSLLLPDTDVFEQSEAVKEYTFTVAGTVFYTVVVLGGVDADIDADTFLKGNWLTWQPQQKMVKFNDPEWLTYYALVATNVKVKAYFKDKDPSTITLTSFPAGKCCSLNMNFGFLSGKFTGQPVYFDVWSEDTVGTQFAFVQRFVLFADYFEHEDLFVVVNSIGGLDTFRFTGKKEEENDFDIESALFDEDTRDYDIDFERIFKKNTGYFANVRNRVWANEFFTSLQKYFVGNNGYQSITISKPKAKSVEGDITTYNYDFVFALSRQTHYLNLSRANELPTEVVIVDPDSELFFLTPRLSNFPSATLNSALVFPVQVPFTESWQQVTYGAIRSDILSEVASMGYGYGSEVVGNADKLGGISASNYARTDIEETFEEGVTFKSSAKFNKHVFYSPDTDEDLLNLRRYGENHTLLNMMSPPQKSWGKAHECTLSLCRGDGNEFFMDLYNMDYGNTDAGNYRDYGNAMMGLRLQRRSDGWYTPFHFEYSSGLTDIHRAMTIYPNDTLGVNHSSVEVNRLLANYDSVLKFETTINGTLTSGNSLISGYIKNSGTFVDGFSGEGWSIGHGPFNDSLAVGDLTVRRSVKFYELLINKIRSGNGSYWFSDGAKVNKISSEDLTGYTLELDEELGNPFVTGQKIRCQVWNGSGVKFYEATISWAGNSTYPNLIKLNKTGYTGDAPQPGDEIVRISGGAMYITSNDNNSPYMDVVYDMNTVARFGLLTGINDPDFGGALSRYGLYCDNVYLKGIMKLAAGSSISFNDVTDTTALIESIKTVQSTADGKINESQATTITNNTVTADYINGLSCSFNQGRIGNFQITSSQIRTTNCHWGGTVAGSWMSSGEYMIYKSTSEYIKTYYTSMTDWGIYGRNTEGRVFQIGSTNRIAVFQFDNNYIWSGTKKTTDGYTIAPASMTIGAGAIRANQFYISNTDGSAHFKGILDAPSGKIGGFDINDSKFVSGDNKLTIQSTVNDTYIGLSTTYVDGAGTIRNSDAKINNEGISFHGRGRVDQRIVSFINIGACAVQAYAEDSRSGESDTVIGVYGRAVNRNASGRSYAMFSDGMLWTRGVEQYSYISDINKDDSDSWNIDIENYSYFSLNPAIEDAYLRIPPPLTDEAREIIIFNRNDARQIHIRWSLIHSDDFVIPGGGCVTLISDKNEKYNGGTATTRKRGWIIKCVYDNNF